MTSIDDAVAFVHKINKDADLQQQVAALQPRDWTRFFALAAGQGYALDHESFFYGCLSDQVVYFCPALSRFAGPLWVYKM